jgi:hypothetical protein
MRPTAHRRRPTVVKVYCGQRMPIALDSTWPHAAVCLLRPPVVRLSDSGGGHGRHCPSSKQVLCQPGRSSNGAIDSDRPGSDIRHSRKQPVAIHSTVASQVGQSKTTGFSRSQPRKIEVVLLLSELRIRRTSRRAPPRYPQSDRPDLRDRSTDAGDRVPGTRRDNTPIRRVPPYRRVRSETHRGQAIPPR